MSFDYFTTDVCRPGVEHLPHVERAICVYKSFFFPFPLSQNFSLWSWLCFQPRDRRDKNQCIWSRETALVFLWVSAPWPETVERFSRCSLSTESSVSVPCLKSSLTFRRKAPPRTPRFTHRQLNWLRGNFESVPALEF